MAVLRKRRVVIVDDSRTIQAMLDNAFSKRPDFDVVGFCSDAKTAAEMIRRMRPDVVTIDLCMPYLDGAALLSMVSDLKNVCKIVVSDQSMKNVLLTQKLTEAGASACLGQVELIDDPFSFFKKINAAADLNTKRLSTEHQITKIRPLNRAVPLIRTTDTPATFPVPTDESRRLAFLRCRDLFNARKERQFDLITRHIAQTTAFPVCLLTFLDGDTQWIKSSFGMDVEQTPRHQAFCNFTISQGGAFVVGNATTDERFSSNELVTGPAHIRSYSGHAVTTRDGIRAGALCVIDTRVRTTSRQVLEQLADMAGVIAEIIEVRQPVAA